MYARLWRVQYKKINEIEIVWQVLLRNRLFQRL